VEIQSERIIPWRKHKVDKLKQRCGVRLRARKRHSPIVRLPAVQASYDRLPLVWSICAAKASRFEMFTCKEPGYIGRRMTFTFPILAFCCRRR
jgi:hypothetical protein